VNRNIIRIAIVAGIVLVAAIAVRLLVTSSKSPLGIQKAAVAGSSRARLKNAEGLLKEGRRAEAVKVLEETTGQDKEGAPTQEGYKALLALGEIYESDNNLLKSRQAYRSIIERYPSYCDFPALQKKMAELNTRILFSKIATPDSEVYTVQPGDTLSKIAKRYSTTVELIKRANGLDSNLIRPGKKLKVQTQAFSIIVDKSQSTLTLISGGEVTKTYIVSTGKNNSTPVGTFKISNKLIDPVWYSKIVGNAIVPPDSPDNVLGTRWMGITASEPGYGIHGTNDPKTIGYQCTQGCVRLRNPDVEELFGIVPVGTEVTIMD